MKNPNLSPLGKLKPGKSQQESPEIPESRSAAPNRPTEQELAPEEI